MNLIKSLVILPSNLYDIRDQEHRVPFINHK